MPGGGDCRAGDIWPYVLTGVIKMKHRIVLIETTSAFGDPVKWYAVQRRVALFWWVTIHHFSQLRDARYWLNKSGAPSRPEKIIKVIK